MSCKKELSCSFYFVLKGDFPCRKSIYPTSLFSYNGSYDTIFKHVSFCIDTNWKLGFIGRNGKGKTTFFHLLMGKYDYSGHISSNVTFEHFPYDVKDKSQWTIEVISQIYPDYVHWQLVKKFVSF